MKSLHEVILQRLTDLDTAYGIDGSIDSNEYLCQCQALNTALIELAKRSGETPTAYNIKTDTGEPQ